MTINLIFPAIVVFSLMLVGLVMTGLEFNRMEREGEDDDNDRKSGRNKK